MRYVVVAGWPGVWKSGFTRRLGNVIVEAVGLDGTGVAGDSQQISSGGEEEEGRCRFR